MGHRDELQIEAVLTATDEVRVLIGELEAVLAAEYSAGAAARTVT